MTDILERVRHAAAVACAHADNENYSVGLTIKDAREIIKEIERREEEIGLLAEQIDAFQTARYDLRIERLQAVNAALLARVDELDQALQQVLNYPDVGAYLGSIIYDSALRALNSDQAQAPDEVREVVHAPLLKEAAEEIEALKEKLVMERNGNRLLRKDRDDRIARVSALESENESMKKVIAWANNSLYGSHNFFLSTNAEKEAYNEHHLDSAIEKLKTDDGDNRRKIGRLQAEIATLRVRVVELDQALQQVLNYPDVGAYLGSTIYASALRALNSDQAQAPDEVR